MTSITGALIGIIGSGGIVIVIVGLFPSLAADGRRASNRHGSAGPIPGSPEALEVRIFPFLAVELASDLAVLGQDRHAFERKRIFYSLWVGSAPIIGWLFLVVFLRTFPSPIMVLVFSLAAFWTGWFGALRLLHAKADRERRAIRYALGLFLELAAVALSGGAGPAEALRSAASGGQAQAFRMIAGALAAAEVQRRSPYQALAGLGRELGVVELEDVGAAMALAEEQGAPVKNTLNNKASSVRFRLMNNEESRAEAMSTAMTLPSVLMLTGFLAFLMFPFVAALLATTG